jgi:hypothetical protein
LPESEAWQLLPGNRANPEQQVVALRDQLLDLPLVDRVALECRGIEQRFHLRRERVRSLSVPEYWTIGEDIAYV